MSDRPTGRSDDRPTGGTVDPYGLRGDAWRVARALELLPAGLQVRRLAESVDQMRSAVLADVLDQAGGTTRSALRSPSLSRRRLLAAVHLHRLLEVHCAEEPRCELWIHTARRKLGAQILETWDGAGG